MELPASEPLTILSQRWQPQAEGGIEGWLAEQSDWLETEPGRWEYAGESAFKRYRLTLGPGDRATLRVQLPWWTRFVYYLGAALAPFALLSPGWFDVLWPLILGIYGIQDESLPLTGCPAWLTHNRIGAAASLLYLTGIVTAARVLTAPVFGPAWRAVIVGGSVLYGVSRLFAVGGVPGSSSVQPARTLRIPLDAVRAVVLPLALVGTAVIVALTVESTTGEFVASLEGNVDEQAAASIASDLTGRITTPALVYAVLTRVERWVVVAVAAGTGYLLLSVNAELLGSLRKLDGELGQFRRLREDGRLTAFRGLLVGWWGLVALLLAALPLQAVLAVTNGPTVVPPTLLPTGGRLFDGTSTTWSFVASSYTTVFGSPARLLPVVGPREVAALFVPVLFPGALLLLAGLVWSACRGVGSLVARLGRRPTAGADHRSVSVGWRFLAGLVPGGRTFAASVSATDDRTGSDGRRAVGSELPGVSRLRRVVDLVAKPLVVFYDRVETRRE